MIARCITISSTGAASKQLGADLADRESLLVLGAIRYRGRDPHMTAAPEESSCFLGCGPEYESVGRGSRERTARPQMNRFCSIEPQIGRKECYLNM
jgi:hypothetical protein